MLHYLMVDKIAMSTFFKRFFLKFFILARKACTRQSAYRAEWEVENCSTEFVRKKNVRSDLFDEVICSIKTIEVCEERKKMKEEKSYHISIFSDDNLLIKSCC